MDIVLFTFPHATHIQSTLHATLHAVKGHLQDLRTVESTYYENLAFTIAERFRSRNWPIVWLLSGTSADPTEPDFSTVSTGLQILRSDLILATSMSPVSEGDLQSAGNILKVMSEEFPDLTRIHICGFYDRGAVEAIALTAHLNGLRVLVHEDLTEHALDPRIFELLQPATELKIASDAVELSGSPEKELPIVPFLLTTNGPFARARYEAEYAYRSPRPWRIQLQKPEDFFRSSHQCVA